MATFWERAARSVNYLFSLRYVYSNFVCFPYGFLGRDFGSDCAGSWLLLIISLSFIKNIAKFRKLFFFIKMAFSPIFLFWLK